MTFPIPTLDGAIFTGAGPTTINGLAIATVNPGSTGSFAGGLVATGSDQAGALAISAATNVVTGGAANTGVRLIAALSGFLGTALTIVNTTATGKLVYPNGSDVLDSNAPGAPGLIPPKGVVTCRIIDTGGWVTT